MVGWLLAITRNAAIDARRLARDQPYDPQVLIDMIFGPIYYRRLVRHQKLDQRFADDLVHHVMAYVRSQPDGAGR